jgi:hypothetical protein
MFSLRLSGTSARASEFSQSSRGEAEHALGYRDEFGSMLTVATAFVYDSVTGRAPNGLTIASAEGRAPVVNWDVVRNDWDSMKQQLHDAALDLERGWKRIAG